MIPISINAQKIILALLLGILSIVPVWVVLDFYHGFYNHDSLLAYITYKYTFDSVLLHNQLPLWNPYLAYGITTSMSNWWLAGPEYFSILLGKIFNLNDSLLFFNTSVTINSFLYLIGIYLVLQHYKVEKKFILYSVILGSFTLNPIHQMAFDFGLLTRVPLTIYSFILLFENPRERILPFILFQFCYLYAGLVPYFSVFFFWLLTTTVFLIFKSSIKLSKFHLPSINIINIFSVCTALILIFCYFLNFLDIANNYQILSPGRLSNGDSSYKGFISYGGYTSPRKLFDFIAPKAPLTLDMDLFLGFIPILLALISLIRIDDFEESKKKICSALWLIMILTLAFTHPYTTSVFHAMIYYLPGMNKVRHLGYFITICKPILIILSGFGLQYLANKEAHPFKFKLIERIFLAAASIIFLLYKSISGLMLIIIFLVAMSKKNRIINRIGFYSIIIIISIITIVIHRMNDFPFYKYKYNQLLFNSIGNNSFPLVQRLLPEKSKNLILFEKSIPTDGFARYSSEITYLREDYCYQIYRQDFLLKNLYKKIEKNHHNFNPFVPEFMEGKTIDFKETADYGCNQEKVKLLATQTKSVGNSKTFNSADNSSNKEAIQQKFSLNTFNPNFLDFLIDNNSKKDAQLVYYDTYHPYWEGFLDNKRIEIFSTDGVFKNLKIPPGIHQVTFRIKRGYVIVETIKALILSILTVVFTFYATRKLFKKYSL